MLLAVDSASNSLGLAITDGERILAEQTWLTARHATIELAPEAARMLRRAGLAEEQLTGLAVTVGPGSFTGLRIGMAFVKGMAFGRGLKVVGIPTLDVVAAGQPSRPEPMLALVHAGRGRWAGGWYRWSKKSWKAEGKPRLLDMDSLGTLFERSTYVCGELTREEREAFAGQRNVRLAEPAMCVRRPAVLADLGWKQMRTRKATDPVRLVPVYTPEAEVES